MIPKNNFNYPISKEIFDNGTIVWTNTATKKVFVFSEHHLIFFDGKDSFWIYGETPIHATSGDFSKPNKITEFYKGNFSHSLYLENEVVFIEKQRENLSDYKIIFKTTLPKPTRNTKEEKIKNHFKDNHLSIIFTETKEQIDDLIQNHFPSFVLETKNSKHKQMKFTIFLN